MWDTCGEEVQDHGPGFFLSPWSQAFSQQEGRWTYLAFAVTMYRSTPAYGRKHVFRCIVSLAGGHGGTEWLTSWCQREGIQKKARIRFIPRVTDQ